MPETTTAEDSLLQGAGLWVLGGYLVVLVLIGLAGRLARRANTLGDFFLAGRGMGLVVLLLTLYATQYSGNTLIGFAASTYRNGFSFLVSILFMMGVVGFYLIYAPRLYRLSREEGFITLGDYIQHRYRSRLLTLCISLSGIIALANFLVTNLKAMGEVAYEVTGGQLAMADGIIILSVIIIIYETLGGLRSVAWTDVIQGVILMIGCVLVFVVIMNTLEGFGPALQTVRDTRPDFWDSPTVHDCLKWTSTVLVVSLGIALYPHAIQRIYAAKSAGTLKIALTIMVFMPFATTLLMISIGFFGNALYPGLDRADSEGITLLMLKSVAAAEPGAAWIVVLFISAVLAAIMSTADSALLSIASSVTQDIVRPLKSTLSQAALTKTGKFTSWLVMAAAAALASVLPQSIWALIQIKLELLVQCAPALLLGLHWKSLTPRAVLAGFLAGTAFTLFFLIGNMLTPEIPHRPLDLHAGFWGLLINLLVLVTVHCLSVPKQRD